MKPAYCAAFLALTSLADGGLIVTDPTLIASTKASSAKDYIEQILQSETEHAQLLKLVEQLARIDEWLKRNGDPAKVKDLPGAEQFRELLDTPGIIVPQKELERDVKGEEVFAPEDAPSVDGALEPEIRVDGEVVARRDPAIYRQDAQMRRSLEQYDRVQDVALTRRQVLRREIGEVAVRARDAATQSEVLKLSLTLEALNGELAAVDGDLSLAANQAILKHVELEAALRLRRKAQVEQDRAALREGGRKDRQFYRLLNKPTLFSR